MLFSGKAVGKLSARKGMRPRTRTIVFPQITPWWELGVIFPNLRLEKIKKFYFSFLGLFLLT